MLIDTSICIDVLRGNISSIQFLYNLDEYVISYVTAGELLQGAHSKKIVKDVESYLETIDIHWGSETIHQQACAILKKYGPSHGIGFFDALIAATAIEENLTLFTHNLKHFQMIKGLVVRKP